MASVPSGARGADFQVFGRDTRRDFLSWRLKRFSAVGDLMYGETVGSPWSSVSKPFEKPMRESNPMREL